MPVYNPIKAMFVFLAERQCIIYRPGFHNSQTSRKSLKVANGWN